MRAAAAWGNGGSNTITTSNMPAHTHSASTNSTGGHQHRIQDAVIYWTPSGNLAQGPTDAPYGKVGQSVGTSAYSYTTSSGAHSHTVTVGSTGGGQHSIQHTRMCMLGTEQPNFEEGGKLCVTFKTLGSKLALLTKRFVHSQLGISICQRIAQVQQAPMGGTGQLSQIVNFCDQAVVGTLQAVSQRINSLLTRCLHTVTQLHGLGTRVLKTLVETNGQSLYNPHGRTDGKKTRLTALITRAETKRTITCRHTGLVTHGIEPLKVGVAYA